jgi:hypothetical protein
MSSSKHRPALESITLPFPIVAGIPTNDFLPPVSNFSVKDLYETVSGAGTVMVPDDFRLPKGKPVRVVGNEIDLDLSRMETEQLYEVEYEGERYAVKLSESGVLETYEVV